METLALLTLFCVPFTPPAQQGDERFYQIRLSDAEASVFVADTVSPFEDFTKGASRTSSSYSLQDVHAFAQWEEGYSLSLMYFGSWWGGNLRGNGQEIDLRCHER